MSDIQDTENIELSKEDIQPKYTTSIPKIKKLPAKLVVVGQVYHQLLTEQPVGRSYRYGRPLESDNYPFIIPRVKLTQEWKQIDSSWIEKDKCSVLLISNNEGKNLIKIPTREEVEDTSKRVIEIGFLTTYLFPSLEEINKANIESKSLNVWDKIAKKEVPQPKPIEEITPLIFIPPGEEHPFSFIDLTLVFFRSRYGEVNATFSFYPN